MLIWLGVGAYEVLEDDWISRQVLVLPTRTSHTKKCRRFDTTPSLLRSGSTNSMPFLWTRRNKLLEGLSFSCCRLPPQSLFIVSHSALAGLRLKSSLFIARFYRSWYKSARKCSLFIALWGRFKENFQRRLRGNLFLRVDF